MSHRRKKCREEAAGAVVAGPASRPPTSLSGKPPLLRQSLGSFHLGPARRKGHAHPGSHWKRRQCQRRQRGSVNVGEVQFFELLANQVQRLVHMMLRA